jgi:hypothetical protein
MGRARTRRCGAHLDPNEVNHLNNVAPSPLGPRGDDPPDGVCRQQAAWTMPEGLPLAKSDPK